MIVVIPTHGRATLLHRTLESLSECVMPGSFRHAVVVENGGKSAAEEIVKHARSGLRARYMYSEPGNKSLALNLVLESEQDGLIVFLDDDVRVAPDLLTAYETAAASISTGRFFGGPTEVDYEAKPKEWLIPYLPPSARGWRWRGESRIVDSPAFLGFNWAAFRRDLLSVGGFDPDFGPGSRTHSVGQETTMQARLMRAGVVGEYVPDAVVWHYVPPERCSTSWVLERSYRNAVFLGMRHEGAEPTVGGVPRWAYRAMAKSWFRSAAATFDWQEVRRFESQRDYQLKRGFVRGCRLASLQRRRKRSDARGPQLQDATSRAAFTGELTR